MTLDERKRRILQAIIDDYIDTAEPIGSRSIAKKHELGLSSATIRNEMADLEEMGYLVQPHTSAGRVPSDKGYRLYVDQLMKVHELNIEEIKRIKAGMEMRINELSQFIRQASAVLSNFTKYTSMAVTPPLKTNTLKAIQVVPIEKGKAMVIIVTNAGSVRNSMVLIPESVTADMLIVISNMLNSKLMGMAIEALSIEMADVLEAELGVSSEIIKPILEGARRCFNQEDSNEVFIEGTTNIFNHPEFKDIVKARDFMSVLDEKESLGRLLVSSIDTGGIKVRIGDENDMSGIKSYSLITATYNISDIIVGSVGIIGPTRMEYPKVISSMKYIKKIMDEEVTKLLGLDANKEKI